MKCTCGEPLTPRVMHRTNSPCYAVSEEPRLTVVQMAGALPRDPEFREWVSQQDKGFYCPDEFFAGDYIRQVCGIQSRRELATDTEAQARFHNLVRRPFVAWKEQQEQTV